jgi:glycosidase
VYRIIGTKETDHGRFVLVEFSVEAKGRYAYLIGNFNSFNDGSLRMRREGRKWIISTELPEGIWSYAYSIERKYVLDDGERRAYSRKSYDFSKETNVCRALGEGYERPFHCREMAFTAGKGIEIRLRTTNAKDVFLLSDRKRRMERFAFDDPFEYYRIEVPHTREYSFEVDGEKYGRFEHKPDERDSLDWLYDRVFYQLMVDRFTGKGDGHFAGGTLRGLLKRVGHIKDVGANALYLTPIFSSDTYHGYDIKDYYSIEQRLGDENDFEALSKNIRVMLDGVFHHTSVQHPFFQDLLKNGEKSAYKDFYRPLGFPLEEYETFFNVKNMPRLNQDNEKVYGFIRDVVNHWICKGAAAWRMDVTHGVPPDVWEKLRADVPQDVYLMGEIMDDARMYLKGFDGAMNYSLYEALIDFFVHGKSAESLLADLQRISARYNRKEYLMYNFLDNHDTSRFLGLVGGRKKYLCALAFLMTYKGLPSIFYGDEIGLKRKRKKKEEQREPMVWDREKWDEKILEKTRELITLRRNSRALQLGSFVPVIFRERRILFERTLDKESILVGINYSNERTRWPKGGRVLSGTDDGRGYSYFISKF